eukprot:GGOE01019342.1.p1 GENE.GGOE01019342.1~~GGOE01019342.1.p1  ORF type:complete len:337 (+),score=105.63 GGOE01019342.1:22-1011(+)
MADTVPLLPLLACCALTAGGAGRIIREVDGMRDLWLAENKKSSAEADSPIVRGVENMDSSEVVTVADRRAQDHIVNSLQQRFPALHIVGEEGHVLGTDAVQLTDSMVDAWIAGLPSSAMVEQAAAMVLPLATTCVWVDPLDGTKEFACGRVHSCCVLIGITVDGGSKAGIVLEPFRANPNGDLGVLHIGVVGLGMLVQPGRLHERAGGDPLVVCGSIIPPEIRGALNAIQTDQPQAALQQTGGCGNKLLRVLEGTFDGFLQGKGVCRWDTCAGEALLRCCGGALTDMNGQPYHYDQHGDFNNTTGVLAARSEDLHHRWLKHCRGCFPET